MVFVCMKVQFLGTRAIGFWPGKAALKGMGTVVDREAVGRVYETQSLLLQAWYSTFHTLMET